MLDLFVPLSEWGLRRAATWKSKYLLSELNKKLGGANRGERCVSSSQACLPRNLNYFRRTLRAFGVAKLSGRCEGFRCLGLRNGTHPGTWCLQLGSLPNTNKWMCKTLCQTTLEERRWDKTAGSVCSHRVWVESLSLSGFSLFTKGPSWIPLWDYSSPTAEWNSQCVEWKEIWQNKNQVPES